MRYCTEPRCTNLVESGRCEQHQKAKVQGYDRWRGTASARGYGSRWGRYRASYLEAYPFCGDRAPQAPKTTDSRCQAYNRLEPATVVDHIIPVTGPTDPSFYEDANHQALCESCHNVKRQRERRFP